MRFSPSQSAERKGRATFTHMWCVKVVLAAALRCSAAARACGCACVVGCVRKEKKNVFLARVGYEVAGNA